MSAQRARYWAEPYTVALLAMGLTPKMFGELSGGERMRIIAAWDHERQVRLIMGQRD